MLLCNQSDGQVAAISTRFLPDPDLPQREDAMAIRFPRYTVSHPEEADLPRSRRELNAIRALGAILNKPNWWTKWTNADIRDRWFHEITVALVNVNLDQVVKTWPRPARWQQPKIFGPYLELATYTGDDKQAKVDAVLQNVLYPPAQYYYDAFIEGESYESDTEAPLADDEEDIDMDAPATAYPVNYSQVEYDMAAIDTKFKTVFEAHKKKNSFGHIGWYLNMLEMRERLRNLPLDEWTEARLATEIEIASALHDNVGVLARTQTLILQAVQAPTCTIESVKLLFPNESRENVIKLLHLHVRRIRAFVESTKQDITRILDLVVTKLNVTSDGVPLVSGFSHPGPVPQTWISDNLITATLRDTFVSQLAPLEDTPDDQKDWHPNSNDQVLNLVHPSLFCGVKGVTKCLDTPQLLNTLPPTATAAEHMRLVMFAPTPETLEPEDSYFSWLPCEVDVDEDYQARIRTYINNLHPETHADLYNTIGAIFSKFVPLFDQVLSTLDSDVGSGKDEELFYCDRGNKAARDRVDQALKTVYPDATSSLRRLVPPGLFGADNPRYTLRGKRCQVIVKIAQIILTPEQPEYAGGSWHIEATDTERIISTGLYYYGCENITESRLSFRTFVNAPDYEQSDDVGVGLTYGLANEELLMQSLGSVTAMQDRCVVFPNTYQHKVEPFRLEDPTKPGVRKILAFFLIDPTNGGIPSTAVVPPQQQEWIDRAAHPMIQQFGLPDVVSQNIKEMSRGGMSLEQAKSFREDLMEERSPNNYEDDEELVFSLCEH